MTPAEQAAFVKAYIKHVDYQAEGIAEAVHKIVTGEKVQHPRLTSILDTLGIWFEATKYQMQQQAPALTASLSELYRHAGDTESGEHAIELVEKALEQQQ